MGALAAPTGARRPPQARQLGEVVGGGGKVGSLTGFYDRGGGGWAKDVGTYLEKSREGEEK
ncbi:hypothetical protein TIFTF001_032124 [Ficus carica]|uniref:Uncharacterized protein n=1 Tax=Ficus carica TaxID=3494 RepID=A0AA88DXX0_FICCA|nr:hypothetical protein TIFTF001_032124 [Ficus carica]